MGICHTFKHVVLFISCSAHCQCYQCYVGFWMQDVQVQWATW